jgi:hypothetical protein
VGLIVLAKLHIQIQYTAYSTRSSPRLLTHIPEPSWMTGPLVLSECSSVRGGFSWPHAAQSHHLADRDAAARAEFIGEHNGRVAVVVPRADEDLVEAAHRGSQRRGVHALAPCLASRAARSSLALTSEANAAKVAAATSWSVAAEGYDWEQCTSSLDRGCVRQPDCSVS